MIGQGFKTRPVCVQGPMTFTYVLRTDLANTENLLAV